MPVADRNNNDALQIHKTKKINDIKQGKNEEINPCQGIAWSDKDNKQEEQNKNASWLSTEMKEGGRQGS